MPQASEIAWLIPVFPLIGAVLSGLGLISINKKINNSREIVSVGLITFVGISAVISYKALIEQVNGYQSVEKLFVWANAGDFTIPMGFVLDPLGSVMLALVTTITLLKACLFREESRGGHYRDDFPDKDKNWECHTRQKLDQKIQKRFIKN